MQVPPLPAIGRNDSFEYQIKTPGGLAGGFAHEIVFNRLRAVEQDAGSFFFVCSDIGAHRAIEELVVFEVDLKEGWPRLDLSGDESL